MNGATITPDRLIRFPEVKRIVGASRSTIDRKELAGEFPRRVPLGPNSVAWAESEVRTWVAQRIELRAHQCGDNR